MTEEQIDDLNESDEFYSSGESTDSDFDEKEIDPDVAAVKQHTERKLKAKNKNLVTVATMKDSQWQDDEVAEMEARLREMMEAQNIATLDQNVAKAMSHKRRETLMSLLDTQGDDNRSVSGSAAYAMHMGNNRSQSSLRFVLLLFCLLFACLLFPYF